MSTTVASIQDHSAVETSIDAEKGVCWSAYFKVIAGIALGYIAVRVYMHNSAYTKGLDYFEPEFAAYWMSMLWFQAAACISGARMPDRYRD